MHPAFRVGLAFALAGALALALPLAFEADPAAAALDLKERAWAVALASGAFASSLLAGGLRWLLARDLLPADGSPGLLLVAGGMLVLLALTVALLLRGAIPSEPAPVASAPPRAFVGGVPSAPRPSLPAGYRGPRDQEFERGRVAGARIEARALDDLLDYMVEAEVGQPRILRSIPNLMRLRLHGCRGCADPAHQGPSGQGVDGCAFECGLLESSLAKLTRRDVIVHEVACRGRGAAACDFEVWY